MVGAYFTPKGRSPIRVIIMTHKSRDVMGVMAVDCKPFAEYGNGGIPSTYYSRFGYVGKRQLFGLRSNRISEGDHEINVAQQPAEVLNG